MAKLYRVSGEAEKVVPPQGTFSYEELQKILNCESVETIRFPSRKVIAIDANGKLKGLPQNPSASAVWQKEFPKEEYPDNNSGEIVGDAVVGSQREMP